MFIFPFLLLFYKLFTVLFRGNEIYEAILFQFIPDLIQCSLFYEENTPLWSQQISFYTTFLPLRDHYIQT